MPLERRLLDAVGPGGRVADAARYHIAVGGKRLRARLALAAGLGLGCRPAEALPIAAAVELLHNASLVHDDLQDGDRMRRGELAVWARFDRPTALLLGDTLLASAFSALAELESVHLAAMTRSLARCVAGLAAGQVSDDGIGTTWTVEAYEDLARAKTGLLFALPCELACLHVYGDGEHAAAAGEAFSLLGVAFQILDDIADMTGSKGRAPGSDLRCGRLSAVVLHHHIASSKGRAPRPTSSRPADDALALLPIEQQVQRLLDGPGVPSAIDQQDETLRRAEQAARSLPQSLRRVLREISEEVGRSTRSIVETARAEHELDRTAVRG